MNLRIVAGAWMRGSAASILLLALSLGGVARAQGTFGPVVVLRTGGGTPLVSSTQALGNFSASSPAFLQFAFGFSTDEEAAPGVFLDSLTLTLSDRDDSSLSVIYNTTDRNGAFWAPPGSSILLSADSILRSVTNFPALDPQYAHQFSYFVTAPVPDQLLGRDLNFYADLFDNGNTAGSLGWVSGIQVVPEPSTIALAAVGLVFLFALQWRNE